MNKDIIKLIGTHTAAFIVGAAVSFFVTKKIAEKVAQKELENISKEYENKEPRRITVSQLTKEQRDKINNEILQKRLKEEENMKKEYKNEIEDLQSSYPKEEDINDENGNDETELFDDDGTALFDEDGNEILFDEDGNELGDPNDDYIEDKFVDDEEDQYQYFKDPYKDEDEDISIISQEEYDEDEDDYGKETLYYYEDDKILADADNNIQNLKQLIGNKALDHFGDMSGDPTVVYVRNEELLADYEVQLVHGSYKHLVEDLK